jgi:hypothetical protein
MNFLNYSSYIKGNLRELSVQYRLPINLVHYFPQSWNNVKNYSYVGDKPELREFFNFSDTALDRENKKVFYDSLERKNWQMKEELLASVQCENLTLTKSLLHFLTQCFEVQALLAKKTGNISNAVHPFGSGVTSLTGFTHYMYRFYFASAYEMYTVMNPYSNGCTNTSEGEYEWTSWKAWKNPQEKIVNFYNSFDGQKSFGRKKMDAYSHVSKTAYFYHGCEVISFLQTIFITPQNLLLQMKFHKNEQGQKSWWE